MLNSSIERRCVRHTFGGSLDLHDFIQARQYVEQYEADERLVGILWDFRLSYLVLSDDRYQVLSRSIVNPQTSTPNIKRAFLVGNDEHFRRVEETLGSVILPWPWGVFVDEGQAFEWLTD
ncbi:MAG: hypothetical protein AAF541_16270 [Pseudomonadota bacterium]